MYGSKRRERERAKFLSMQAIPIKACMLSFSSFAHSCYRFSPLGFGHSLLVLYVM